MLAIGRALLGNPELLIMDEPSEGLAPTIVEGMIATCKTLVEEGMAILLVEQNLGVATLDRRAPARHGLGPDRGRDDRDRARRATRTRSAGTSASSRSRPEPEEVPVPTVVLVGTLDTKGREYAFLADRIREHGVDVVLVDAGIVGEPLAAPDVTREEVAAAAGADVAALAAAGDRGAAVETMARGAAEVVKRLHAEGRLDAIGGLGGSGGSALATHAMRELPIGVPKLMVSTVASGDTSPYVGSVDVTMMYSVVDIAGVNRVSARIMANAAGALAGMAKATVPDLGDDRPIVVASMFGVTTPAVTTARERLEELGYEVLVFHQTGAGGGSMEKLLEAGLRGRRRST